MVKAWVFLIVPLLLAGCGGALIPKADSCTAVARDAVIDYLDEDTDRAEVEGVVLACFHELAGNARALLLARLDLVVQRNTGLFDAVASFTSPAGREDRAAELLVLLQHLRE